MSTPLHSDQPHAVESDSGSGSALERLALQRGRIGAFHLQLGDGEFSSTREVPEILGVPPASAFADVEDLLVRLAPEDRATLEQGLRRAGAGQAFCADLRLAETPLRWICIQAWLDPNGHEHAIAGTIQDVSKRKAREQEIAELNALLVAAIQQVPTGIIVADATTGTIRLANPAALGARSQLDRPLEEIAQRVARGAWQAFWPDGTPLAREQMPLFRALLYGETARDVELVIRFENGTERWILTNAAPVRNPSGEIVAAIAAFPDVTERRCAEQERHRFEELVMESPLFIGTASRDEVALFVNPYGRKLVGIGLDQDVTRLRIRDFHTARSYQRLAHEAFPTAAREGLWAGECEILDQEGRVIPAAATVIAHRGRGGEVDFFSAVMRDRTQEQDLETQLLHSQKLEAIGRLAGGVAHDFNNLLTAVLGNAEMALMKLDGKGPVSEVLAIRKAGERAARLTSQLLAFARRQISEPQIIDVNDAVRRVDQLTGRLLGEDIDRVFVLEPEPWSVKIDPGQLEQVLINLALNARDAMPGGGRLTIETHNVTLDASYRRVHPDLAPGEYVQLVISDTGHGMDPEVQQHAFEPFFTTKEHDKGTGLGLATCHGIVKQSGGHIWLYSEPGLGTTFKILLPRVHGDPERTGRFPTLQVTLGRETLLLVEDEEAVREVTSDGLRTMGYTVLTAASGQDALHIAEEHAGTIDALVTDVVLPGFSGKEVADRLTALRPELKVLFCSGFTDHAIVERGILMEGVNFLPKPYTPREMAQAVRRMLDGG